MGIYGSLRNRATTYPHDLQAQQYLRLLVTILFSFLTTAILIYPEEFRLDSFPFSYLGRKITPSGLTNVLSRIVFNLGMFLSACTMWLMARHYRKRHPVPDSPVYEFLSYLSAAGFTLMLVPCDVTSIRIFHSFGSGFVVGSHLIMSVIRLSAVSHHINKWTFRFILLTLLFPVLVYAIAWILDNPWHPLLQKPAFAAMIFVELYGSRISRNRNNCIDRLFVYQ